MSAVVERCKRAVRAALLEESGGQLDERLLDLAVRTTITALRQPELDMVTGAAKALNYSLTADWIDIWRAMIDEALK